MICANVKENKVDFCGHNFGHNNIRLACREVVLRLVVWWKCNSWCNIMSRNLLDINQVDLYVYKCGNVVNNDGQIVVFYQDFRYNLFYFILFHAIRISSMVDKAWFPSHGLLKIEIVSETIS